MKDMIESNKILDKSTSTPVVKCYQVVAYNDSLTVTRFGLITVSNSTLIYASGKYSKGKTWTLDLTTLSINPGGQYYIKAMVEGSDSLSDTIVQYDPTSTVTAYFDLTGSAFETTLNYLGVIGDNNGDSLVDKYKDAINKNNSLLLGDYKNLVASYENSRKLYVNIISDIDKLSSTPILKCSNISALNYTWTVVNWQLSTTDGAVLYVSGNQTLNDIFSFTLSKLQITVGTQLRLKALVVMGDDSTADVILEYQPTSNVTGYFQLNGSAFKTNVIYLGTSYPW